MTTPAIEHASTQHAEQPESVPLGRRELLVIAAFWAFFAVLTAANRMFEPRSGTTSFSMPAVIMAALESLMWALLTPAIFALASRFNPERGNRAARVLALVALGLAVALFVDVVVEMVRTHYFPPPRRRGRDGFGPPGTPGSFSFMVAVTRFRYVNDLMVYLAVLAAGVARDYFLRYRARQEEAVRLVAHAAQLDAQLAEARLAVLRTQVNPHFLFNTLHAVSALVERDPRGVRRMIARLSELLRYTLEGGGAQEVPLREELELLARYLEIMQVRFQGRLETRVDVAPALLDALVPTMILQPLVENAVKHGVDRAAGPGRLEVRAERAGDALVITVRDNGPGPDPDVATAGALAYAGQARPNGGGLGLRNTRDRLAQLYGAQGRFALRAAPGGGTDAELVLPYHTGGEAPRAAAAAIGGAA